VLARALFVTGGVDGQRGWAGCPCSDDERREVAPRLGLQRPPTAKLESGADSVVASNVQALALRRRCLLAEAVKPPEQGDGMWARADFMFCLGEVHRVGPTAAEVGVTGSTLGPGELCGEDRRAGE
jgi:hypothetical protein